MRKFSFKIMWDLEIDRAFTFDRHFKEQGFEIFPGQLKEYTPLLFEQSTKKF